MSIKTAKIKFDILILADEAKKAKQQNPNIINATIGSYFDDNGEFKAYPTVKNIIHELSDSDYYSYAITSGGTEFEDSVAKWVFKDRVDKIKSMTNVKAVSTPGGTGAVFMSMVECLKPGEEILIADLCWEPYITMASVNNFVATRYSMFNDKLEFNVKEFKHKCNKMLNSQDIINVILNDPCNNPTGYSLSMEEFTDITNYFDKLDKPVNILYDIAYADYCLDEQEVLDKFEILANLNPKVRVFICFSASKTFCAYGMRLGAQLIMSKDKESVDKLYKRSCVIGRTHWSNINKSGISMFNKLVNTPSLLSEFKLELNKCKNVLQKRLELFVNEAKAVNLPIYACKGGFFVSMPCDNTLFVFEKLKSENIYVIPLESSIRVAICAVSLKEIPGLATKIKEAMDLIPNEE